LSGRDQSILKIAKVGANIEIKRAWVPEAHRATWENIWVKKSSWKLACSIGRMRGNL
jgi:hypothetical protein